MEHHRSAADSYQSDIEVRFLSPAVRVSEVRWRLEDNAIIEYSNMFAYIYKLPRQAFALWPIVA